MIKKDKVNTLYIAFIKYEVKYRFKEKILYGKTKNYAWFIVVQNNWIIKEEVLKYYQFK